MKHILLASLLTLGMMAFTGCTDGKDANVAKCQSGKCDSAKKTAKKCGDGKCGDAKKSSKTCGS
jgi:hypothetical protein